MEVIVTLVRLVYHDAASIGLELEIADAVLLDVSHHIWEHALDEVCTGLQDFVLVGGNIPYPQILNSQNIATDLYGIIGIPHIILFVPDGTILARGLRGEEIQKKLAEIFEGQ